ncbi:uncharacterized SAM-binding protein YcdF (DUF218 family) [Marinobacter sp. LV10MA510-1]|nr:uncharacterized SAM-binding protein YcdF (DUF218 family) [Marinobacter sp. LV10MA510-1]
MFFMSKLVIFLISPLGSALLLGSFALLCSALRFRRLAMACGLFALLWLWGWSLPVVSLWAQQHLEAPYPALTMEQLPSAAAAVVLGGGVRPASYQEGYPDLGSSADRVWHAARLFHAGKVPLLVLAGGSDDRFSRMSEAEAMRILLADFGVPASAMVLEERSRTTGQNAVFVREILAKRQIDRVLLVTSALHMSRALALFQGVGLEVIAVATDHSAYPAPRWRLWLPSARALDDSGSALKEWVGRLI